MMKISNRLRFRAIWQTLSSLLRLRLSPEVDRDEDLAGGAAVAEAAGMFPVEPPPPPTSCAARWASSRAVGLLLAAVVAAVAAASMKRSAEISSASDLLKRELIPLPNARPGDEAEGTLRQNRSGK